MYSEGRGMKRSLSNLKYFVISLYVRGKPREISVIRADVWAEPWNTARQNTKHECHSRDRCYFIRLWELRKIKEILVNIISYRTELEPTPSEYEIVKSVYCMAVFGSAS
jgi:hypothetical protein